VCLSIDALNGDWFRCELCSSVIASSAALMLHYIKQHKLPLISTASPTEHCNGYQQNDNKHAMETQLELVMPSQDQIVACVDRPNSFDVTPMADISLLPNTKLVYAVADDREDINQSVRLKAKLKRRRQSSAVTAVNSRLNDVTTVASKMKCHRQSMISNRVNKTSDVANTKTSRRSNATSVFPCSVCGKVFRQRRYLHKHSETHGAAHACEVCGKTYRSRAYLRLHSRRHVAPETPSRPRFACSECDFSSDVAAAIHAHRQVHAPSDSVRCAICGGAYADRASLSKHRRVHDTARPFACPLPGCAWRFRTDVMCRAHVRAHTIAGRFNCAICGYVFRRKHHLQRHEIRMHADSNLSSARQESSGINSISSLSVRQTHTNVAPAASMKPIRNRNASIPATVIRSFPESNMRERSKALYVTATRTVADGKSISETRAVEPDVLPSTMAEDKDCVPPSISVSYNHLVDDDCNFTALLDMSDVELEKKNGHLIVDDFDLFH